MLDEITELLHLGGDELLRRRHGPRTVERKRSIADVVTDADRASEAVILERLSALAPGDGIVAEECGHVAGRTGRSWVVDPLDGTTNYGAGLDDFGVIIGVVEDGRPVAGGMLLPVSGELYLAATGGGATRNGEQVRASATTALEDAVVDHSLANLDAVREPQAATLHLLLPRVRGMRSNHSLRYLANVACGVEDAFVYHGLGAWDITGPSVILAEAGAVVTDLDGAPLDLSTGPDAPTRSLTALGATAGLHGALLAVLAGR